MKIQKIKLFSYVHKVEGAKNWVLEDLIKKKLYVILSDENDVFKLKEKLIENELAYETKGEHINKLVFDLSPYEDFVRLRNLYIRVTDDCSCSCNDCGDYCLCYSNKNNQVMGNKIIKKVIAQFRSIPIQKLVITGGNPYDEFETLRRLKNEILATEYIVLFKDMSVNDMKHEQVFELGYKMVSTPLYRKKITESKMKVDPFTFFYSQKFDLCLGHSVGIDVNGNIKPCLWHDKIVGNIAVDNIKLMIQGGKFDEYWNLSKDKIDKCNRCEFRYACMTCQMEPTCCEYDPMSGVWKDNGVGNHFCKG